MRIAVLADAHGNLPALKAALRAIGAEGCDAIYHLGDAIAIGPFPAESLDLLLSTPNLYPLMGNHDLWFARGLPQPQPEWMSDGEVEHQHWVHAQLDPALRPVVGCWPFVAEQAFDGVRVVLLHYEPADSPAGFADSVRRPSAQQLDATFGHRQADILLYGHTHVPWDVTGRARYLNPGPLGCGPEAVARFALLECRAGHYCAEVRAIPYDDAPLRAAFAARRVPERDLILRAFFGR